MNVERRILLIDDNDDQRTLLANALQSLGWRVEGAHSGKQGLEAVARVLPDLVLTELILPDVRGFELPRLLRSQVQYDLVVIALTRVPEQLHGRALMSGFDHVHRKPVVVDELHARMLQLAPPISRAS